MGRRRDEAVRTAIWAGYDAGLTLVGVSRSSGCSLGVVHREVSAHGGIRPRVRERSTRHLRAEEREQISRGLASDLPLRRIAARLGRPASTVSREIARNGGRRGYRAVSAEQRAWVRGRRPQAGKLQQYPRLHAAVVERLSCRWSPQQIAADLKRSHPHEPSMQVSHETLYRSLFIQARGALKEELVAHLRRRGRYRRRRHAQLPQRYATGPIPDPISIRERPAEVEDRAVPGHWEGDLIVGSRSSCIATLVERHSRYVLLQKIADRKATTVAQALACKICELPEQLRLSLTWDCGSEMARHVEFTLATRMAVYFCDPHSPWQRGSNENTNGLLRQYFPKGTDLSGYTQQQLDAVAKELNQRPRQTLGWLTPAQALAKALH